MNNELGEYDDHDDDEDHDDHKDQEDHDREKSFLEKKGIQ